MQTRSKHAAIGESLRYLNWLYNPFQRLDVTAVYELLADRSPTSDALYLNLGYWRDERVTLDEACRDLVRLVGDAAELGPAHRVVDVGFGFGDQDIEWLERCAPSEIIGLNVTGYQVAAARRRVAARGLADRIRLLQGSATAMPLESGAYDRVLALECAFHFKTREDFFAESLRVLRPGGRLVTADILPNAPGSATRANRFWDFIMGKFDVPRVNAYTRAVYAAKLEAAGFVDVRVESIRDRVYVPLSRYLARHPERIDRLHPMARPVAKLITRFDPEVVFGAFDYVLAQAGRP